MIKRILAGVVLVIMQMAVFATPARAMDPPDSEPSVNYVKVNTYLIEEGDQLIYGEYNIPYGTIPDDPAEDTFVFRLMDGTTEIAQIRPFCMMDNGYNKGVFAFYFPASNNITWDVAYTIRISKNPAYFTTANSTDYTMPLTAYTWATEQETNQLQLAVNLLAEAQRLTTEYSSDGYTFTEDSAGGTVLSSPTGETYFRGAIYGVQAMAPDLFLVQVLGYNTADTSWTTDYGDNMTDKFAGTFVGDNTTAVAEEFGLSTGSLMGMIFTLPVVVGFVIVSFLKYRRGEPGFIASALVLAMSTLMGWFPIALFASIYQAFGIYLAWVIMGRNS